MSNVDAELALTGLLERFLQGQPSSMPRLPTPLSLGFGQHRWAGYTPQETRHRFLGKMLLLAGYSLHLAVRVAPTCTTRFISNCHSHEEISRRDDTIVQTMHAPRRVPPIL